jgi:hypothetical protein
MSNKSRNGRECSPKPIGYSLGRCKNVGARRCRPLRTAHLQPESSAASFRPTRPHQLAYAGGRARIMAAVQASGSEDGGVIQTDGVTATAAPRRDRGQHREGVGDRPRPLWPGSGEVGATGVGTAPILSPAQVTAERQPHKPQQGHPAREGPLMVANLRRVPRRFCDAIPSPGSGLHVRPIFAEQAGQMVGRGRSVWPQCSKAV